MRSIDSSFRGKHKSKLTVGGDFDRLAVSPFVSVDKSIEEMVVTVTELLGATQGKGIASKIVAANAYFHILLVNQEHLSTAVTSGTRFDPGISVVIHDQFITLETGIVLM